MHTALASSTKLQHTRVLCAMHPGMTGACMGMQWQCTASWSHHGTT